jgi:hypothetical protein
MCERACQRGCLRRANNVPSLARVRARACLEVDQRGGYPHFRSQAAEAQSACLLFAATFDAGPNAAPLPTGLLASLVRPLR